MKENCKIDHCEQRLLNAEIATLQAELAAVKVDLELAERLRQTALELRVEARDELAAVREALAQLIRDYENVPDPSDSEGQAVFERARRALKK